MFRPSQLAVAGLVCVLTLTTVNRSEAQITRREANKLGVDVLTLKIGGELRGLILQRSPAGTIQMAVRREWLAAEQPELLKALPPEDFDDRREVSRRLITRIDDWLADLGADDEQQPESPNPGIKGADKTRTAAEEDREELLRVLHAERSTYQQYVDDPLKLPAGEGSPAARRTAYQKLIRRIDEWTAEIQDPQTSATASNDDQRAQQNRDELIRILKSERGTYQQLVENPDQPTGGEQTPFVRITLSRADVRLIFAQPPARRQLAIAAWQHNVPGVETLTITDLQSRLAEAGADWKDAPVEPSKLLGLVQPQDDRQWAARRAVYEYQFLKRLDFQGTGNFVVQTGEDAPPPNLADVLQGTLDQQMSLALGDLLDEPIFTGLDFGGLGGAKTGGNWLTKATRTADTEGVRGFRVTRMTPDIRRRQTLVEDRFLAKMPDGSWETIWMVQETKSAQDADQHDLDRIKQDPQLKEVLGLVEGLGLGNRGQLDLALQFGAATMNAQQATDDEFYEFRDRYSKRLDGPPLSWK